MKDDKRLTQIMIDYNKLIIDHIDLFERISDKNYGIATHKYIAEFFEKFLELSQPLENTVDDNVIITVDSSKYDVIVPNLIEQLRYVILIIPSVNNHDNYDLDSTKRLGQICFNIMKTIQMSNQFMEM